ncbi:MAG: hypothetical protein COA99_07385 [Moraxellaceae bacterium]|nr:MAG: hypothetical protein COA99_07385 [Moraxellaceae bacterium]
MRTTQIVLTLICILLISGCEKFNFGKNPWASQDQDQDPCTMNKKACSNPATRESQGDIVTILTGKPLSFVESHLGLPNQRSESASGAMTWVYIDKSKRITEKDCKMSISIRNDIIERVNITVSNASLASALDKGCARIRQKIR